MPKRRYQGYVGDESSNTFVAYDEATSNHAESEQSGGWFRPSSQCVSGFNFTLKQPDQQNTSSLGENDRNAVTGGLLPADLFPFPDQSAQSPIFTPFEWDLPLGDVIHEDTRFNNDVITVPTPLSEERLPQPDKSPIQSPNVAPFDWDLGAKKQKDTQFTYASPVFSDPVWSSIQFPTPTAMDWDFENVFQTETQSNDDLKAVTDLLSASPIFSHPVWSPTSTSTMFDWDFGDKKQKDTQSNDEGNAVADLLLADLYSADRCTHPDQSSNQSPTLPPFDWDSENVNREEIQLNNDSISFIDVLSAGYCTHPNLSSTQSLMSAPFVGLCNFEDINQENTQFENEDADVDSQSEDETDCPVYSSQAPSSSIPWDSSVISFGAARQQSSSTSHSPDGNDSVRYSGRNPGLQNRTTSSYDRRAYVQKWRWESSNPGQQGDGDEKATTALSGFERTGQVVEEEILPRETNWVPIGRPILGRGLMVKKQIDATCKPFVNGQGAIRRTRSMQVPVQDASSVKVPMKRTLKCPVNSYENGSINCFMSGRSKERELKMKRLRDIYNNESTKSPLNGQAKEEIKNAGYGQTNGSTNDPENKVEDVIKPAMLNSEVDRTKNGSVNDNITEEMCNQNGSINAPESGQVKNTFKPLINGGVNGSMKGLLTGNFENGVDKEVMTYPRNDRANASTKGSLDSREKEDMTCSSNTRANESSKCFSNNLAKKENMKRSHNGLPKDVMRPRVKGQAFRAAKRPQATDEATNKNTKRERGYANNQIKPFKFDLKMEKKTQSFDFDDECLPGRRSDIDQDCSTLSGRKKAEPFIFRGGFPSPSVETNSSSKSCVSKSADKKTFKMGMNGNVDYKTCEGPVNSTTDSVLATPSNGSLYSTKVFLGGLPQDAIEADIMESFEEFGVFSVDWPYKEESRNKYPPKGFAFLMFEEELSVQALMANCEQASDGSYYSEVSSLSIKKKIVEVRPWLLAHAKYISNKNKKFNHRNTIFVGGISRTLKAQELANFMTRTFGPVSFVGIDTDMQLNYPKGSSRVIFERRESVVTAITTRFVEMLDGYIPKRIELKPYVLDHQMCDECNGENNGGKFAPYFCANVACLKYFCKTCWQVYHARVNLILHRPTTKQSATDRPRAMNYK